MDAATTAQQAAPSGGLGMVCRSSPHAPASSDTPSSSQFKRSRPNVPFTPEGSLSGIPSAFGHSACSLGDRAYTTSAFHGFADYPGQDHFRQLHTLPEDGTPTDAADCDFEQYRLIGFYHKPASTTRVMGCQRIGDPNLDWLPFVHRTPLGLPVVADFAGQIHSRFMPTEWQSPCGPDGPFISPRTFRQLGDPDVTMEVWRIMHDLCLNPFTLLTYFCFIPDPKGQGPLTVDHPLMRRVAAVAYCATFPSAQGILFDVSRECGRHRAEQVNYSESSTRPMHPEHERFALFTSEISALQYDACGAYRDKSRLCARIRLASVWAGRIRDPSISLGRFDPQRGYIHESATSASLAPLVPPLDARVAYTGWPHCTDCTNTQMQQRTRWTAHAVDELLE